METKKQRGKFKDLMTWGKVFCGIIVIFYSSQVFATQYTIINLDEAMGLSSNQTFEPTGINDDGQIIGHLWEDKFERTNMDAIVWDKNGGITTIASHKGVYGINNNGQVVGEFGLWDSGVTTPLVNLGGQYAGYDISDSGQIVGFSRTADSTIWACLWNTPTDIINLGSLGGDMSKSAAINNLGQVTGYSKVDDGSEYHGFYWDNTSGMIDIGGFENQSGGTDINIHGQITGTSGAANDRAFIWEDLISNGQSDPGEMISLGTLGGASFAGSINDNGNVVGRSDVSYEYGYGTHAFYYDEIDGMVDLISLLPENCGWETLSHAKFINNNNQIIGYGTDDTGEFPQPFLMEPVPEPATVALLGLGGLALVRKQR